MVILGALDKRIVYRPFRHLPSYLQRETIASIALYFAKEPCGLASLEFSDGDDNAIK